MKIETNELSGDTLQALKKKHPKRQMEQCDDLITRINNLNIKDDEKYNQNGIDLVVSLNQLNIKNEEDESVLIPRGPASKKSVINDVKTRPYNLPKPNIKEATKNDLHYNISSCNSEEEIHLLQCRNCLLNYAYQPEFLNHLETLLQATQRERINKDCNIPNIPLTCLPCLKRRESIDGCSDSDSGYLSASPSTKEDHLPEKSILFKKLNTDVLIYKWIKVTVENLNLFKLDSQKNNCLQRLLTTSEKDPHVCETFYVLLEYMKKELNKCKTIIDKKDEIIVLIEKKKEYRDLLNYFIEAVEYIEKEI